LELAAQQILALFAEFLAIRIIHESETPLPIDPDNQIALGFYQSPIATLARGQCLARFFYFSYVVSNADHMLHLPIFANLRSLCDCKQPLLSHRVFNPFLRGYRFFMFINFAIANLANIRNLGRHKFYQRAVLHVLTRDTHEFDMG